MFISDCFLLRCIPYKTLKAIWKQLSPNNASVVDSFWYDALSKRIQKATKNQALESSNFTEICHSSPVVPPLLLLQDLPCAWPKTNGSTGRSSQEYWDFSHGLIPGFTRDIPLYTAYPNSITRMTRMTMIFGWRCEPGIFNLILKGRKDWNLLGDNQETLIQFKVWSCWVSWVVKMIYHPIIRPWKLSHGALDWNIYVFFPTCQVRVVRFYVSLFSSSSFSFFSSASSSVSLSCCDSVCSVWHVGPQLRSCEFSVACWTSTAILWVQCGVSGPNRDPACSVWRAGPQLWSRVFSAVCRTSTAILRVQCGVPGPNRDPACSVWRAGPQLWSRVFSAVCRTSTAILRVQCGIPDLNRDYASSVWRAGPHLWWKGLVVVAERVVKEVVARCHKISQIEC